MDKDQFLKLMRMSPEEMEAYGSPSIMDDYIKENDPEQWEKIRNARSIQDAINLGLGTAGAMKLPGKGLMGKFGPIRKNIGEAKGELPKEIYNKAIGHLTPENPNIGKVTQTTTPEQALGKVTQKQLPEEAIGKVTNVADDEALSLAERIKKMEDTLDYDERFQRLNELLKQKKAQKGE